MKIMNMMDMFKKITKKPEKLDTPTTFSVVEEEEEKKPEVEIIPYALIDPFGWTSPYWYTDDHDSDGVSMISHVVQSPNKFGRLFCNICANKIYEENDNSTMRKLIVKIYCDDNILLTSVKYYHPSYVRDLSNTQIERYKYSRKERYDLDFNYISEGHDEYGKRYILGFIYFPKVMDAAFFSENDEIPSKPEDVIRKAQKVFYRYVVKESATEVTSRHNWVNAYKSYLAKLNNKTPIVLLGYENLIYFANNMSPEFMDIDKGNLNLLLTIGLDNDTTYRDYNYTSLVNQFLRRAYCIDYGEDITGDEEDDSNHYILVDIDYGSLFDIRSHNQYTEYNRYIDDILRVVGSLI